MLTLSRKIGERIRVGNDIWITLLQIRGNKVKIGIEAPNEVIILREEVIPSSKPLTLKNHDGIATAEQISNHTP